MNKIEETKKLQQKNADRLSELKDIIIKLITKANKDGFKTASKAAVDKLDKLLNSLRKIEAQSKTPPKNVYHASIKADEQKKQIFEIIQAVKSSLNITNAATLQTKSVSPQHHSSPEKPRVAITHNYAFPSVPTTPVKPITDQKNLLLDTFIAVDKKLSQSRLKLSSLNQIMLSEKNTDKKVELSAQISNINKEQQKVENNLKDIYKELSNPQKINSLKGKLDRQLASLNTLEYRMDVAFAKSLPIAPTSKVRIASDDFEKSNGADESQKKGPRR